MKILIASDFPENASQISNGVEAVAYNLAPEMARIPEIEIQILTCKSLHSENSRNGSLSGDGLVRHCIESPNLPEVVNSYIFDKYRIARKIAQLKPDIIIPKWKFLVD